MTEEKTGEECPECHSTDTLYREWGLGGNWIITCWMCWSCSHKWGWPTQEELNAEGTVPETMIQSTHGTETTPKRVVGIGREAQWLLHTLQRENETNH